MTHPGLAVIGKMIHRDERTSKVAHYTLIAESMNAGLTSVLEFPWPTIIAVAAITLGIVALKRKQRSKL